MLKGIQASVFASLCRVFIRIQQHPGCEINVFGSRHMVASTCSVDVFISNPIKMHLR